MSNNKRPLTDGIRQAIRDSPRTVYQIGKLSGVSPQNLSRFLDEGGNCDLRQHSPNRRQDSKFVLDSAAY